MANIVLILFMIATIILLFVSMIFSAIGANKSKGVKIPTDGSPPTGGDPVAQETCHKNSTISALITGISTALILVILVVYIYTTKGEIVSQAHSYIGKYVPAGAVAVPSS